MGNIIGSILGKPVGKTGGVVFGGARSRTGKVTTVRSFVPPSNPNTVPQQQQRSKFSACQSIVRRLGPSVYQSDFNRSIGQLPGFQSMNSIFLNQMDSALDLSLSTPINLGVLHNPATVSVSDVTAGTTTITYSTENGDNGTANDTVVALCIAGSEDGRNATPNSIQVVTALRSAGTLAIANLGAQYDYQIYLYIRGAGTALGLLSVANYYPSNQA